MNSITTSKVCVRRASSVAKSDSITTKIVPRACPAAALSRSSVTLKRTQDDQALTSRNRQQPRTSCTASANSNNIRAPSPPKPKVRIDNLSDPLATIITVEYGNVLGELIDTVASLKNLGLNIVRAALDGDVSASYDEQLQYTVHKFYVTDSKTSEKVQASERLEEIRMTIINNMVTYHPEASTEVKAAVKSATTIIREPAEDGALGPRDSPVIPTSIKVTKDGSDVRSRLDIVTTDRPGLLVDIVRTLKDVSVNVVAAEIDTIGLMAHDILFLTYQGQALSPPMEELVRNALYYYLVLGEMSKEESY